MKKTEIYSYISDDNEKYACDSYSHIFHILKKPCWTNSVTAGDA